jgi:hypothetical protein
MRHLVSITLLACVAFAPALSHAIDLSRDPIELAQEAAWEAWVYDNCDGVSYKWRFFRCLSTRASGLTSLRNRICCRKAIGPMPAGGENRR